MPLVAKPARVVDEAEAVLHALASIQPQKPEDPIGAFVSRFIELTKNPGAP